MAKKDKKDPEPVQPLPHGHFVLTYPDLVKPRDSFGLASTKPCLNDIFYEIRMSIKDPWKIENLSAVSQEGSTLIKGFLRYVPTL